MDCVRGGEGEMCMTMAPTSNIQRVRVYWAKILYTKCQFLLISALLHKLEGDVMMTPRTELEKHFDKQEKLSGFFSNLFLFSSPCRFVSDIPLHPARASPAVSRAWSGGRVWVSSPDSLILLQATRAELPETHRSISLTSPVTLQPAPVTPLLLCFQFSHLSCEGKLETSIYVATESSTFLSRWYLKVGTMEERLMVYFKYVCWNVHSNCGQRTKWNRRSCLLEKENGCV